MFDTPSIDTFFALSMAFANESWVWVAAAFGAGSLLILILTYRNTPLRGGAKALAMLLKAAGLILLALALLEPVHLDELPKKHSNDVAILADNSAGMAIALTKDLPSPAEELAKAVETSTNGVSPAWMDKIGETFRLQNYRFSRGLTQDETFSDLNFEKNSSSLISALRSVDNRFARRPLAATVVLTDGNATDAHLLEEWLKDRETREETLPPVFPVLVGQESDTAADLSVADLHATTTQFEDARVTLNLDLQARGEFPDPVEVFVRNEKGEEIGVKQVAFPPGTETRALPVRMRLGAVLPGISFLTVGVRQVAENPVEELTELNNSREISVNRGTGPYRILYVSGRPNWEYKFLRRSIAQDAELELTGLIRIAKREPKFEWRGRSGESGNPLFRGFNKDIPEETQRYDEPVLIRLNTSTPEELRDGFPKTAEDLFPEYRAIILDDVESEFFTQEQQELIDQFVAKRGGTLVMLGGQESFQQGSWDNTSVGRLLPVYLDRIGAGGPALDAAFDLTREGWLEPWMRLRASQEEERTRLAYMPAFFAINQISAIKPGASILATVTDGEGRNFPAIVTQKYGSGRTAAITVADFWRWAMKDPEQQTELAKSWRQILRWSVSEVPARVEVTKEEVIEGALPLTRVSVRLHDKSFEPQDDATVNLKVTHRNGETTALTAEPSLDDPGLFTAEYLSESEGGYRIEATAIDGNGLEIGKGEVARSLNPVASELARFGPNSAMLKTIADATGGNLLTLDELDTLPSLLDELDLPVMEVRQRPLWHTPWLFALAFCCFLGEWALRRKQGIL